MSSASAAWPAIDERRVEHLGADRPVRVERDERQRPEHLGRRRQRDHGRRRAALEERHQRLVRRAEGLRGPSVEDDRRDRCETRAALPASAAAAARGSPASTPAGAPRARSGRRGRARRRAGRACAGRPRPRRSVSTIVRVDRLQSLVEREALGERARDFVERAQPPRSFTLGVQRLLRASSARLVRSCRRAFSTATASCAASASSSSSSYSVSSRPASG